MICEMRCSSCENPIVGDMLTIVTKGYFCNTDCAGVPSDWGACGTCGYDHGYEGSLPGIADRIDRAHRSEIDDMLADSLGG